MTSPARRLALRVLLESDAGGASLGDLLATAAPEALSRRDRALLHELVLGTLRRRGATDTALARVVVDRPLQSLDRLVLAALRLGAHQLLWMRVPAHAAVSETVELLRDARSRGGGLANAALRRLAREGAPAFPDPRHDPLGWLVSEGSLPHWLAARWLRDLGPEAAVARGRAFLELPPASFRVNPRRPDAQARIAEAGLAPKPLPVPGAWQATAGTAAELAAEGVLYLQDAGSQLAAQLAARPGLVLDACAAPGGKSLLLSDLAGGAGRVVAADASLRRLRALAGLAGRWGAPLLCLAADALRPPFRTRFDSVLLDAPCSGLGTLSRRPDIRWRVKQPEIARQAARQARLLESLSSLVKPGGRLVYSVCSPEPEEGAQRVEAFLAQSRAFRRAPLPAWAEPFRGPDGFLRTGPETGGGDAFFVAPLDRD